MTLLAINLPKPHFEVNVLALNRGGYYEEQLKTANIPVQVLEKRFRFDPLTFTRLRRKLRATKPDVVQSFLFSANSYVRLPGVCPESSKIVVSERCVDSWKSGWQLRMDRWLSDRMDAMTANSESVADFYSSVVGVDLQKIAVIPNGVPAAVGSTSGSSLREELGVPPTALVLGFAGRLAPQKCLNDLVWGFHLLHQAVEDAVLVLVGDGPERDQLAEFATSVGCRDRVFFTGHRNDAAQLIAQFDVFCLPSSFEGMSSSLTEAMAAGVPVVASDISSNQELVAHEQTGLLIPLGDSVAICKATQRIMSDADFARQLATNAKQLIQQKYSVEQMVQSHVELYQSLIAG